MRVTPTPTERHRIALDKAARSVKDAVRRNTIVQRLQRMPVPTLNRVQVNSFAEVLHYAAHGYLFDKAESVDSVYMVRQL